MDFTQRRTLLVLGLIAIGAWLFLLAPPSSTLPPGSLLPEVTAELPDGEVLDLAALRGQVVVLTFWAVWCGPCRREAPILNGLHAQGVAVFGLGVDDKPAAGLLRDAESIGIRFPVGAPSPGVLARLRVSAVPTIYVIDPQGQIVLARTGEVPAGVLEQAVAKARGS
jgi:cytochrome c biogenesis protein CcmG/thiol:disulfide interchange protein DsbE